MLKIMINFLKNMDGGFTLVNHAAKISGESFQKSPYSKVVEQMTDPNFTKPILTFFNLMIFKATQESELFKFLACLENQGVFDKCRVLAAENSSKVIMI